MISDVVTNSTVAKKLAARVLPSRLPGVKRYVKLPRRGDKPDNGANNYSGKYRIA